MATNDTEKKVPIISRFAVIALFFGTLLVFFVPPMQPPDEDSHFTRLMSVWIGGSNPSGDEQGGTVPISLIEWVNSHRYINGNMGERYTYQKWYEDSHLNRMVAEPRTAHKYSGENISIAMYIPSIIGVTIGNVLYGNSSLFNYPAALYFGRLGNLAFYILGVCLALAITPAFRSAIAFLSLTPVSLHLAASVQYDTMTIVPALLLIAIFIRRSQKNVEAKPYETLIVCVSLFLLAIGKVVYLPLALPVLYFLNWNNRRETIRQMALMIGSILLGLTCNGLLFSVGDGGNLAEKEQLLFVSSHPVEFLKIVFNTLNDYGPFYAISAFGNIGSLDTNFSLPIVVLIGATFAIVVIFDAGRGVVSIPLKLRTLMVIAALSSCLAFMLATYIVWTSHTNGIGAPLVDGVQGRYFLPLFFFLAAGIIPTFKMPRILPDIGAGFFLVSTIVLTMTILIVLLRYWI